MYESNGFGNLTLRSFIKNTHFDDAIIKLEVQSMDGADKAVKKFYDYSDRKMIAENYGDMEVLDSVIYITAYKDEPIIKAVIRVWGDPERLRQGFKKGEV